MKILFGLSLFLLSLAASCQDLLFSELTDGMYVSSLMDNEGLSITIADQADGSRFVFIAWFTYAEDGSPLYLAGGDNIQTGSDEFGDIEFVIAQMFTTEGGVLGPTAEPTPAVLTEAFRMSLQATEDCNVIRMDYELPDGTITDAIFLSRFLSPVNCDQTLVPNPVLNDLLSGDGVCIQSIVSDNDSGRVITLQNGQTWETDSFDRINATLWLSLDTVTVCPSQSFQFTHVMTNIDRREAAGVSRLN
ncbi:MAG: hypothetical protein AAF358_14145 [Pseudomonadota bacterium]